MGTKITDKSIMTFGKAHKGKQLSQVPDAYLLWMWREKVGPQEILDYIEDNLDNLKG